MQVSPKTVLLVDDGANDRMLFELAGKKAGASFGLRFAADGQEAVEYLNGEGEFGDRVRHPVPDLLILDLNMPRMSGFEVLEWIRERPSLRPLRVVVLTASAHESDIRRAYALSADSYLVKPLGLGELADMIKMIDDHWIKLDQSQSPYPTPRQAAGG